MTPGPRYCLVTTVVDDVPLRWGLEFERVRVPMVLMCTPGIAEQLDARALPTNVRVVVCDPSRIATPTDRLDALVQQCAADATGTDWWFWVECELLYSSLSLAFLYDGLLDRVVEREPSSALSWTMSGRGADGFFGARGQELLAHAVTAPGTAPHFAPTNVTDRSEGLVFVESERLSSAIDLNLRFGVVIDEPVVHVFGDSHVLYALTPQRFIGARTHILMRTSDITPIDVPYRFQFTHHAGARTMHHAGRSGALLAMAAEGLVKPGDAVVWLFGEIDVRSHILKRHRLDGRSVDEIVETLARDFLLEVQEVELKYDVRSVVVAPIPPLDNPHFAAQGVEVHGSIEERIDATRRLRAALARECAAAAVGLVVPPESLETPRGDLRWELSDGFCHVAMAQQQPIVERLYETLARGE